MPLSHRGSIKFVSLFAGSTRRFHEPPFFIFCQVGVKVNKTGIPAVAVLTVYQSAVISDAIALGQNHWHPFELSTGEHRPSVLARPLRIARC